MCSVDLHSCTSPHLRISHFHMLYLHIFSLLTSSHLLFFYLLSLHLLNFHFSILHCFQEDSCFHLTNYAPLRARAIRRLVACFIRPCFKRKDTHVRSFFCLQHPKPSPPSPPSLPSAWQPSWWTMTFCRRCALRMAKRGSPHRARLPPSTSQGTGRAA